MAREWIKMRTELWTHPKFIALSNMLVYSDDHPGMLQYTCGENLDLDVYPPSTKSVTDRALRCVTKRALRDVTMCALLRVWCAVNAHGKVDGVNAICSPMNTSDLDEIAGFADFGEAMVGVGWAQVDKSRDAVIFLNFLEHNELASERIQPQTNADRQRKWRENQRSKNGQKSEPDETVTTVTKRNDTEEKRREEKKIKSANALFATEDKNDDTVREKETADSLTAHQQVWAAFNAVAPIKPEWPLTEKRRRALSARLRDKKWDWLAACEKISQSRFLMGHGSTGWKITFDWFLKPDSVMRINEGQFDDGKPANDQFAGYEPPKARNGSNDQEGF